MSFENLTSDSVASSKLFPAKIISPEFLNFLLLFLYFVLYLLDILIEDFFFILVHLTGDVEFIFLRADHGNFAVQKQLHIL